MLVLRNSLIVNGDGRTQPFAGSILIDGHVISAVTADDLSGGPQDTVLDLGGRIVLPGAINAHAHAAAPGPRFASGTPGISLSEALGNLRRHLAQGHTTVVDLDGFKVPEETAAVRGAQPVKVEASTVHFEPMFAAADAADGSGLKPEHRAMTPHAMRDHGAVVIGEVGAGMTLGGGGQDYMYIPRAVENAIGVLITPLQAMELKYAVLGRHIRPGSPDRGRVAKLIGESGLEKFSEDEMISLIEDSVLPSMQLSRDGLIRSATLAVELGLPTLVHNAAASDEACREAAQIAGPLFIGGHTNHDSYSVEESVANARWIRENGGHVEIDTFDAWGRRELQTTSDHMIAMIQEDLVDIIATDYAAGHWDGIWEMVAGIVQVGLAPIEKAVALATGNVAKALPRIGADRGLLKAGFAADLVVTSRRNIADVELVVIDGATAYSKAEPPAIT